MIELSKIMEFNCQFYIKTGTKLHKKLLTSMRSFNASIITSTKQIVITILF